MRLHTSNDSQPQPPRWTNGVEHAVSQPPPSSTSTTNCPPIDSLGQPTFSNHALLESGNLLEWLMSDLNGAPVVPLPLVDFPGPIANDSLSFAPPGNAEIRASEGPGNMAVDQIYRTIDDLSKRLNSDVHRSGFTSAFLDSCLHEYFKRISPSFPVIHERTFQAQKTIPPLLLNMVALGSLFVCEKEAVEKGEMLWRLGHTAVATSWQTLIEIRGPWDSCDGVQLVLTALIGQAYALLSSNTSIRTTASVFHGLGFYWARTSGMYSVPDVLSGLPDFDLPEADKNTLWKTWAATEVQRRAILGHYILDGLISQASGSPASARHLINSLGTACSDAAFAAKTADEWILEITRSNQSQIPVCEAFTQIFAPNYSESPLQLSHFSTFVMIEGLQSLIADLHEIRGPVFGTVSQSQIVQAMLNIHQGNIVPETASDFHRLPLLIRWHCVFIETTAPSIAIYRWLCDHYELPQVLGGIHAKSQLGNLNLIQWVGQADAFRAVLHAISITRLLDNLPLSQIYRAMHIPTAVFTSAMIIATKCLFNGPVIKIPERYTWFDVWKGHLFANTDQESLNSSGPEDVLRDLGASGQGDTMVINLLDELNSLQVILKTVASRWGVSAQMGDIIGRLAVVARESRHTIR